ncbi:MAG: InlB B-repeat-containing protein, partial [Lachnospirales bacterium]
EIETEIETETEVETETETETEVETEVVSEEESTDLTEITTNAETSQEELETTTEEVLEITTVTFNESEQESVTEEVLETTTEEIIEDTLITYENSISLASAEINETYPKYNGDGETVIIGTPVLDTDATEVSGYTAFNCTEIDPPDDTTYITISVDTGYFTVPGEIHTGETDDDGLTFKYGIYGDKLITTHVSDTKYTSITFGINDFNLATASLDKIIFYKEDDKDINVKINCTNITLKDKDIYMGHIYRLVDNSSDIHFFDAVVKAHETEGYGENGYLVNVTSKNENTMLLNLIKKDKSIEIGASGSDNNYNRAWIGGTAYTQGAISKGESVGASNRITYEYLKNTYSYENYPTGNDYLVSNTQRSKEDVYTGYTLMHEPGKGSDFYWVDGPEAGMTLPDNKDGDLDNSSKYDDAYLDNWNPWHQSEPNAGVFAWIGYQGPYWDDFNPSSYNTGQHPTMYIVEFGGMSNESELALSESENKITIGDITVSYDSDGGSENPETQITSSGSSITLPSAGTKLGFAFDGWYDGDTKVGMAEDSFKPSLSVKLKAKWVSLIAFKAETDSGYYFTERDDDLDIEGNKKYGAVSFSFGATQNTGVTDSLEDIITNNNIKAFGIYIYNDNKDIAKIQSTNTEEVLNNSDKANWFFAIVDTIPTTSFNDIIYAMPYIIFNDDSIMEYSAGLISKSVNGDNWVIYDWND